MSVSVCVSVCLSVRMCISGTTWLWNTVMLIVELHALLEERERRKFTITQCDTLCISGFMDGVIFARKGHMEACRYRCSEWRHSVVACRITPLLRRIGCLIQTPAGTETTRWVPRTMDACSGACSVPLHCCLRGKIAKYCDHCPVAYLKNYMSELDDIFWSY